MLANKDNRVVNELKKWQQMESQWKDLLGPGNVRQREYMQERLRHLKEIPKKYAGQGKSLSREEKTTIGKVFIPECHCQGGREDG